MLYFKYHGGYETGENLLNELISSLGKGSVTRIKEKCGIIKSSDVLMRWGDTSSEELDDRFLSKGARVLNKAKDILRNTNKLKSLNIFKDNGLNVPKIFMNKASIDKFPVLGRDKNHTGGTDIVVINGNNNGRNNLAKIPNKDFYIDLIPAEKEFRVHIFNGKVIRVTRKVFRGRDKDGNLVEQENIVKNDTYGWGHANVALENLSDSNKKACIKAVGLTGLNFGAIDLLIEKSTQKPYVLEINSSPRLNTIGQSIYVDNVARFLRNKSESAQDVFIRW